MKKIRIKLTQLRPLVFITGILLASICAESKANVYKAQVRNKAEQPIPSVEIAFLNASNDTIKNLKSNSAGRFVYTDSVAYILFAHPDYAPLKADVIHDKDGVFIMSGVKALNEVVVTPELMKQFHDHQQYTIPRAAMKKYINFLQSLNEIPFLKVTPDNNVSYEGQPGVRLMVNGVEVSANEVASISKDDIYKVNVYTIPPKQLVGQNVTAAVDILLKSSLKGGSGGINARDYVTDLFGTNDVSLYYNYKRSRFSLFYEGFHNSSNNSTRYDETIRYNFNGNEYDKIKTGEGGKTRVNENNFKLAYQNGIVNDYMFDLALTGNVNRVNFVINQKIKDFSDYEYSSVSNSRTPQENIGIRASFSKQLGPAGKKGSIYAALQWTLNHSKFFDSLSETPISTGGQPFNAITDISSHLNNYWGMFEYSTPYKKWGQLTTALQGSTNRYKESGSDNKINQTFTTLSLSHNFNYRRFYTYLYGSLNYFDISAPRGASDHSWNPSAMVQIQYLPNRKFRVTGAYQFYTSNPATSQMTETPQWRDNYYVYHGNANLKMFSNHNFTLNVSYYNKYFQISARARYMTAPNYIGTMFVETPEYVLETLVNQKKYRFFSSSASVSIYPLGNKTWDISGYVEWGRIWGRNSEYSYKGKPSNYHFSTDLNFNKWNAGVWVQLQSEKFNGVSTQTRQFTWSISGSYRPIENLSVGIEWNSPFMKHTINKEYTIPQALVYMNRKSYSSSLTNGVQLRVSYYFSFGKKHNRFSDAAGASTNSGILKRN